MSYKNKDGQSTSAEEHPPLPCRGCFTLTARVTLLNCGGWCFPCFQDYCRTGPRLVVRDESPTVRDMKTRLRGRLASPDLRKAA